ncbi:class III extradiol dioxygenase subunit B-like domain-containing protein [Kribbella sp. NPDC000426]|uniref:class III extradiol dioxygenase subunit B-like domain-containing protein n=1 Tax=Kribbella sp. NPDC000426 TaxID=3154255 RepID=UPI00331E3A74
MPVVAAAVCPHPPLLVPEVASGAAPELDDLRAACLATIDALSTASTIVVIGSATSTPSTPAAVGPAASAPTTPAVVGPAASAPTTPAVVGPAASTPTTLVASGSAALAVPYGLVWFPAAAGGSFGAYGAPGVRVGSGDPVLPLSLAIGGWLLEQSKAAGLPRTYVAVPTSATPTECVDLGREIAAGNDRVGLLVMGDGSARRSEHSPVHLHPRAEIFDTTVANALQQRDLDALAALDPDLAAELQAAGRAPWQALAGALEGATLTPDLTYNAAPYGVGYLVASFT